MIRLLPGDSFECISFLGKKTVYRFGEVREVKRSIGSVMLRFGDRKVYIDDGMIRSKCLNERMELLLREYHVEN